MRGVLTLLVVLLLAAGFLLLRGHVGPEPDLADTWERDPDPAGTAPVLRTDPSAPGETRPSDAHGAGHDLPGGARAFAGIRGLVEDERGRALPGATVRLETLAANVFRGATAASGEQLATATADRNGVFELPLDEHRWVRVVASATGRATVGTRVAGPGTFVRLVLPAASTVEVEVVDTQNEVVSGAAVEVFAREAVLAGETDEQGRVLFADVAPGPVSVTVRAAGGRRAHAGPLAAAAGATRRLTLLLPAGISVRGSVRDAATLLPIAGAEVHAAQPGLSFAAEPTGPDGSFGPLAAGGAGSNVLVAVRAAGYAPRMLRHVLAAGEPVQQLPPVELRPAADWRGRVVDARGRAVAGARVAYTAAGIAGRTPPEARTDEEGRFTLPPPSPPAPGRRVVLMAEGATGTAAHALRPGDAPPADLVLVLVGGHAVTGSVVAADGEPLPAVGIRFEPRWSEIADRRKPGPETARLLGMGDTARLALATATDARGGWRLDGVPDGTYDVRLLHDGATDFLDEALVVGGADVDAGRVRFGEGHEVSGFAGDEAGRPLAGVGITLREAGSAPRLRRTVTDEEGAWRLAGVPPGAWHLDGRRADRSPVRVEVEVPTPEPLDLTLPIGTRLSGRVVDADGRPHRGVFTVGLEGETPRDRTAGHTFRDGDGRFVLEGVLPGTWTARVVTPRGALGVAAAPVEVRPGTTFDVTIELGSGAVLSGTLRRPDGSAVRGGRVALTHAARRSTQTCTTTSGGAWRASGLDEGTWRLVARGRGGAAVVESVELGSGELRELDLVLGPVAPLEVTVRGEDGGLRVGAYVLVRPADAPASRPETVPRTDAEGRVALADVPLGAVVIEARLRSGESGRTQVEVSAASPRAVEIVVAKKAR